MALPRRIAYKAASNALSCHFLLYPQSDLRTRINNQARTRRPTHPHITSPNYQTRFRSLTMWNCCTCGTSNSNGSSCSHCGHSSCTNCTSINGFSAGATEGGDQGQEPDQEAREKAEEAQAGVDLFEAVEAAGSDDDEMLADPKKYCICDRPAFGRMLGCDGQGCEKQWFHLRCLGLSEAPKAEFWFCAGCVRRRQG